MAFEPKIRLLHDGTHIGVTIGQTEQSLPMTDWKRIAVEVLKLVGQAEDAGENSPMHCLNCGRERPAVSAEDGLLRCPMCGQTTPCPECGFTALT